MNDRQVIEKWRERRARTRDLRRDRRGWLALAGWLVAWLWLVLVGLVGPWLWLAEARRGARKQQRKTSNKRWFSYNISCILNSCSSTRTPPSPATPGPSWSPFGCRCATAKSCVVT